MAKTNYTTKTRNFKHLSPIDRGKIEYGLKSGHSMRKIAREIGFNVSTISREIRKGTVKQRTTNLTTVHKYFADLGQLIYEKNRNNSGCKCKLLKASPFIQKVEKLMKIHKWSPDAAIGRLKLKNTYDISNSICTKTMYKYVDLNLLKTRNLDLLLKVKLKSKTNRNRINKRKLSTSIEERPLEINTREKIGDFEIDCVIGKKTKSSALLTLTERKSLIEIITKIDRHDSKSVGIGIEKVKKRFGVYYEKIFNTVTSDNGSEFSSLEEQLGGVDVYYAHPYSSYERGSNENQNRVIRRFIPKGKDIGELSDFDIQVVENYINNMPRKKFGYKTSLEVFTEELVKLKEAKLL